MGSYYYLASQLPFLIYGQTPPMSAQAFRELARPLMKIEDAALLDLVGLDPYPLEPGKADDGLTYVESAPPSGSEFIDSWREWERTLRLNLAKHRAIKVKREGSAPMEPPYFPTDAAAIAVKAVVATESPLEGEALIDKARWSAIEVLQGSDYFDRNMLYAFLLKLIILERQAGFQIETGFSEYKSLYASILESADTLHGVQSGTSLAGESKW